MTVEFLDMAEATRVAFEARWQPSTIATFDGELYEQFRRQEDLWNEAYATGDARDIEIHAGGMVLVYEAATKRLEGHRMLAYLIGHAGSMGVTIDDKEDRRP